MRPLLATLCCILTLATHAQKFTYLINTNQSNKAIVFQDHLWTGTSIGLIKRSFSNGKVIAHLHEGNSELVSNVISYLAVNKDELWIGTDKGLSIYNESKNTWNSPAFPSGQNISQIPVSDITFDLNGNSWLLGNGNLWKYANGKMEKILPEKIFGAYALLISPDGKLWISCNQGSQRGILIYDGKNLAFMSHPDNAVPGARMFDSKGNFWGALTNGATRYDGKAWTTHSSGQIQAGNLSGFIAEDASGNVWFDIGRDVGVYKGGKVRFIFEEEKLKDLPAKALGYFRNIHFDKASNALLVCRTGVLDYNKKQLFPFPGNLEFNSAEDYVQSFLALDNKLWIVTRNYILLFKDGIFDKLTDNSYTLVGNRIQTMQRDRQGRTWISTEEGTTVIEKGGEKHFPNYSSTLFEGRLVFDKQNRAWGRRPAGDGCFMIDPDGISQEFTRKQNERISSVTGLATGSDGNVFCFTRNGVFLYDAGILKQLPGSPNEYEHVCAQTCDDKQNKCWYVMGYLYEEVEGKTWKQIPIRANQEPDGIFLDAQKSLWAVGKNDTLYRITKNKTEKYFLKEARNSTFRGYALLDADVILWFEKGAARFSNGKFTFYPLALPKNEIVIGPFRDSRNNFWFPYGNLGIQSFNGKAWKIIMYKDMGLNITADVFAMSEDKNNALSLFTDKGIISKDAERKWIFSDEVKPKFFQFVDSKQRVWIDTDEGISVLENNHWKHFTNRTGLLSKKVYRIFETSTGQIIAQHNGGATIIEL
jgi:ligand-binding sensor domain-containing protein